MRLRHIRAADAEAVAALQVACWQESYAKLLPVEFLHGAYPTICRDEWARNLAAPPPGVMLLAERDGQPQGVIAAWRRGEEAYVDTLHVRPGLRGQGLGRRLLGDAMACLGARRAALFIIAGNDRALAFYARLGGVAAAPEPARLHGVATQLQRVACEDPAPLLRAGMTLPAVGASLRPLREADKPAIAAINADPEVMRHFQAPMTRAESDAWVDRLMAHHAAHGFGFCAVDAPDVAGVAGPCAGVVGLMRIPWRVPGLIEGTAPVEIGWRIAPRYQRRGLAEAAARLALAHGFEVLRLPEILAFTVPANAPSWRLMEKLGMARAGAFDHPRLPEGHALRPHLLYRIQRPA